MKGTNLKITGIRFAALAAISIFSFASATEAAPRVKKAAPQTRKSAPIVAPDPNKGFRKKELNFEERVIEGLSNRGYESLSQTGSNDGLKGEKLYRKRAEFDEDSKSLLREMEYLK